MIGFTFSCLTFEFDGQQHEIATRHEGDGSDYMALYHLSQAVGLDKNYTRFHKAIRYKSFAKVSKASAVTLDEAIAFMRSLAEQGFDTPAVAAMLAWLLGLKPAAAEANERPPTANGIQMFDFKGHEVRVVDGPDGEPWWVAKDVCDVLGLGNPSQALARLDDDEKMTLTTNESHSGTRGGAQFLNIINEPGLFNLIRSSRKPEAKAFRRFVDHEVLPSIRKTGRYEMGGSRRSADPAPPSELGEVLKVLAATTQVLALGQNDLKVASAAAQERLDAQDAEIASLKEDVANLSKYRRRVLKHVPAGYVRFRVWCDRKGVPAALLGKQQPNEIHRACLIGAQMGQPAERCHPPGWSEAWYFHYSVMEEWLRGLQKRDRTWAPQGHFGFDKSA